MFEINLKKYNRIILTFFVLDLLFLVVGYSCVSGIIKDIAVGLFISFIFYYIVVFIPAFLHKEAQKKVFLNFYEEFRKSVIREILNLSELDNSIKIEDKVCELLDVKKLDLFFLDDNKKNKEQKNCHTMMNNIWQTKYKGSLNIIVSHVDELKKEMIFLVSKVQIDDSDLLEWVRRMDRILSSYGQFDMQYNNSEKIFIENLWTLLTGKNLTDSYVGDFIKDKIKKL